MISGCYNSRGGTNITRTRRNVTLCIHCLRFSASCSCVQQQHDSAYGHKLFIRFVLCLVPWGTHSSSGQAVHSISWTAWPRRLAPCSFETSVFTSLHGVTSQTPSMISNAYIFLLVNLKILERELGKQLQYKRGEEKGTEVWQKLSKSEVKWSEVKWGEV